MATTDADALCEHLETLLHQNPHHKAVKHNSKHFTYLITLFACMGGLLSGLDQSLISGANLFLPADLNLSERQNSLVNSGMALGAVGGALLLAPLNEFLGRRWSIIGACMLYVAGAALEAGSQSYGMLVGARVVLGLGVGIESGTVPVYVAETAARRWRGNMVSLFQANIALGQVVGYAVAAMFVGVEGNWRFMLGSSLVFSGAMWIGMLFMPESPRWLMHKGRVEEAYAVWRGIRGMEEPESRVEFWLMKTSTEDEAEVVKAGAVGKRAPWLDLVTKPRARRALVYAVAMIVLGQFTGINAIMYYMSVLMKQIGFDRFQSTYMSLVGGGSLLLGTLPAIFLMETCGRRFWAIAMLPGFFVGLVLVGVSYHVGGGLRGREGTYLAGLIVYELFFGSYACLTWVIPAEVFPTYLRSYGMTASSATLFLSSFLVTYNFSAMQRAFTPTGLVLGFYGGIAVVGWCYQVVFMPETKDKTLEEIDATFRKPTREVVRRNVSGAGEIAGLLARGRFKRVFVTGHVPRRKTIVGDFDE